MLAAIAGFLKATVGAHEVITTIMLNWIVIWVGTYLFGFDGPLQNDQSSEIPVSNTIADEAKITQAGVWGHPDLQGLLGSASASRSPRSSSTACS